MEAIKTNDLPNMDVLHQMAKSKLGSKLSGFNFRRKRLTPVLSGSLDDAESIWLQDLMDKYDMPILNVTELQIGMTVGSFFLDVHTVVADADVTKGIKVSLVMDDATGDLDMLIREKLEGAYGDTPAGKTLLEDLKEYQCLANDTQLTEV